MSESVNLPSIQNAPEEKEQSQMEIGLWNTNYSNNIKTKMTPCNMRLLML